MIVIAPYDPHWPEEFETIRVKLERVLGSLALRIDHIGSTSVPGLGAKDVIDVQVTVRELAPQVRGALVEAGYKPWQDITHDHVPFGGGGDAVAWQKMFFNQPDGSRRANIHVRVDGQPNQQYPLLFRDYLRAHPHSVKTVELIKQQLARYHADDIEAYYDIKDPVYDLIWDAALDWSRFTNWKPA